MTEEELFARGMAIRREVVGDSLLSHTAGEPDPFMQAIHQIGVGWAWGKAWGDDAVDRKTKSLVTLAILAILNRPDEYALHVKGAVTNGATVDEIKAILIHMTAYAGVPAGVNAFRAAHKVLKEVGAL